MALVEPYICTYNRNVAFEWDSNKARENVRNHGGVRFEESKAIFDDPHAITITDDDSNPFEKRFVSIGMGALGRVLVAVYTYRATILELFPRGSHCHTNVRSTTQDCNEKLLRFQQGQARANR